MVVGAKDDIPADALWVATADEAFRQVSSQNFPYLETVELRFNGVQKVSPVALARTRLTIRAGLDSEGKSFAPVLTFENEGAYVPDRQMISVHRGELTIEGVQMKWRIPVDRTPHPWALLSLDDVTRLTLQRCILTIENVDQDLAPQQNGAAFVRLKSSTATQRLMQSEPGPTPEINLVECVVRGQADFIAAPEAESFHLAWSQGLLATTEHLADVDGSSMEPAGGIVLSLEHVTVAANQGLCRLGAEGQPLLTVQADHCVFATDPSQPLIEHWHENVAGLEAQSAWGELLRWEGTNNVRLQGEVTWRVADVAKMNTVEFRHNHSVWTNLFGGGAFADYDLAWRNQAVWSPNLHSRTAESYILDIHRRPDDATETPGFSRPLPSETSSERAM